MPNYSLVANAQFEPMSFEQYAAPFILYGNALSNVYNDLGTLSANTSVWEKIKDNPQDAEEYEAYKQYSDELNQTVDSFNDSRDMRGIRSKIEKLRTKYMSTIQPIAERYALRLSDQEREGNIIARDNSWVPVRSAYKRGLSEYAAGLPQIEGVSGNDIYTRTAAAAKAITEAMVHKPEERKIFSDAYYDLVEKVGEVNTEDAYNYIRALGADDRQAAIFGKYVEAMNDVLNSTNYNRLTDVNDRAKMLNYAVNGTISGITYDEKHDVLQNPYAVSNSSQKLNTGVKIGGITYPKGTYTIATQKNSDGIAESRYIYVPYNTGGIGRVLDLQKPIKDENGNVIDYEPIKDKSGNVISFNPSKDNLDVTDIDNPNYVMNDKVIKHESQTRRQSRTIDDITVTITDSDGNLIESSAPIPRKVFAEKGYEYDPPKKFNKTNVNNRTEFVAAVLADQLEDYTTDDNNTKQTTDDNNTKQTTDDNNTKQTTDDGDTKQTDNKDTKQTIVRNAAKSMPDYIKTNKENYIAKIYKMTKNDGYYIVWEKVDSKSVVSNEEENDSQDSVEQGDDKIIDKVKKTAATLAGE